MMRYCQNTTVSYPLSVKFPNHLASINNIIAEEGGTYQPFNNEIALKLDSVKTSSNDEHITRMKSMDMVFGMRDNANNISTLLVDFKLNCRNPVNLREGECRDKIKHSKILLFGSGISIHSKYIFVFNDDILQVSRSVLSRILANASGEAISVDNLKANYF